MSTIENETPIPSDGERLIQDVLAALGWSASASEVADRVRRLDIGLPAEDEFSVICAWLGKCQILHKLDQQQVPVSSRYEFQVPDLLAKFSGQANASPVLIEVKSKVSQTLSFKPDYLRRLQNYANLVNMPLLIAWKFRGLWMLFEAKHLAVTEQNFSINIDKASRENLLGILVGDIAYKIGAGAGVHFQLRKDHLTGKADDGSEEQWIATFDQVAFTDYNGNLRSDLDAEVQSLFTAWDLEKRENHTDSHIQLSYVAGESGLQFAHIALVHLLNWEKPQTDQLRWRNLLQREQVTMSVKNFSAALEAAFSQQVVSHIFFAQPQSIPDF